MSDPINGLNRVVPGLIEPVGGKPTVPMEDAKPAEGQFSDLLGQFVGSVNDLQTEAGDAQKALLAGEPVELHEVMIKAEKAGVAMDLLLEVRNRLISAYNDIVKMPL